MAGAQYRAGNLQNGLSLPAEITRCQERRAAREPAQAQSDAQARYADLVMLTRPTCRDFLLCWASSAYNLMPLTLILLHECQKLKSF